jgi:hypothetical protein
VTEKEQFDKTMDAILQADPKIVKQHLELEAKNRAEARKAKHASSAPGPDGPA